MFILLVFLLFLAGTAANSRGTASISLFCRYGKPATAQDFSQKRDLAG